jgi:hypothetical protein
LPKPALHPISTFRVIFQPTMGHLTVRLLGKMEQPQLQGLVVEESARECT